ncbi:insulin-like growth factor binding proteinn-terminal [Anaeramoeba flamelloides]|uniref:Insulin-like growth factor binding proteinn-terminal n=1 Tax=Anaeramoeba flamelloides TaxID=1746091 RepID=A0AAV7ZLD4_9EUKA|nr:insulin-like growth factor binding proteinn-terminal [Anaeramoeba flamelloides]
MSASIASIGGPNGYDEKFVIVWQSEQEEKSSYDIRTQMFYSTFVCDCATGHFSNLTYHDNCIACSKGEYQNAVGQTQCLVCQEGSYQDERGASGCAKCEPGTFNPYQGSTTSGACQKCSAGGYSDQPGLGQCLKCKPGSYQDQGGASGCAKCEPGTFNPYQGSTASDACQNCSVGEYSDQSGQGQCSKCKPGSYQDEEGASGCAKCDPGTFNPYHASNTSGACQNCSVGEYNAQPGQSQCHECATGKYQDQTGKSECKPCQPGKYQDEQGETQCKNCTIGEFSNKPAQIHCEKCPVGTYSDAYGATECVPCSNGTYNPKEGSTNVQDCLGCEIGTYNDLVKQSSCQQCAMGTYSNQEGLTKCESCPMGTYNPNEGQSVCQSCEPGTYQSKEGEINCRNCEFNTYQPKSGSTKCVYCPMNSETLSTKAQTYMECFCKVGYFGRPGEYCEICPTEGICDSFNQFYPIPRAGYWSSSTNPTQLIKCQIPEACPGYEQDACNEELGYRGYQCTECKTGFFKNQRLCERCPNNATQRLALIFLIFIAVLLFLLYIAKKATAYFGSFTISFAFLQLIAIVYQLEVNWPQTISITLKTFQIFDFNLDFLATECSFNFDYVEKWYMIQLLPFICLVLFVLVYLLLFLHSKVITRVTKYFNGKNKRRFLYKPSKLVDQKFIYYLKVAKYYLLLPFYQCISKSELNDLKSIFINFFLTLLTLLYLILSQKCLEIFDCEYDTELKQYIFQPDANYICYADHRKWNMLLAFAILFMALYILGIPLLIIILLIKNSKKLTEKQFDLKFGLLCSRYNKSFFFWEIIIMLRKLFLVIFKIFIMDYTQLQLILFIGLIVLSLLVQFKYKPYLNTRHNFLESLQLIISIIILFSALIFNSDELYSNNSIQKNLFKIIIVSIIMMGVFFLILITLMDIHSRLNSSLRKKKIENNSMKEIKLLKALLKKDRKRNNFALLFNWIINLNNAHSKKNFVLLNQIFNHIQNGGNSHSGGEDNKKIKNNKKHDKLNRSQSKNIDLFNQLFRNDVLILFLKWYKKNANIIQKLSIQKLLQNFFQYQYITPWQEQKNNYKKQNKNKIKNKKIN